MTRKVLEHGWSPLPSMEFHMKLIEIVRLNSVRKENVIEFHERLRKQKKLVLLIPKLLQEHTRLKALAEIHTMHSCELL